MCLERGCETDGRTSAATTAVVMAMLESCAAARSTSGAKKSTGRFAESRLPKARALPAKLC